MVTPLRFSSVTEKLSKCAAEVLDSGITWDGICLTRIRPPGVKRQNDPGRGDLISARSVWFLSFSVFSWVVVVAVSVWIAKSWATEEGWENIQPIGIIFLNAVKKRFVMVLPSIIGLLFVLARSPKEGISSD